MGPRTTPTPVQLRGAFPLAIISDLDRGDTRVSDELVVTVGGKVMTDAVWHDEGLIEGTAPTLLPPGAHDVVVDFGGRETTLVGGYVVFEAAWEPPRRVALLADVDDDPTLTGDMLELYFNRNNDIFVARRETIGTPWSTPVVAADLSSSAGETTPELMPDGLTMFVASDRSGAGTDSDIYIARRTDRGMPFGVPVLVPELGSIATDSASAPAPDLLAITMVSNRNGADFDIFMATRSSVSEPFGTPVPLAEINTPADDFSPFLTADGLTLYLDSLRNNNDDALYVAYRRSVDEPFSTPVRIVDLDAPGVADADPWVSPDERHVVFVSARDGTVGLWESSR
jgi:hypothetical protein